MIAVDPFRCLATCLAATLVVGGVAHPVAAANWQEEYLQPAVQAWMGVVTLLADDGEAACEGKECRKGECKGECKEHTEHGGHHHHGERRGSRDDRHQRARRANAGHHAGHMHHPGTPARGRMGPPRPEGPRGDALALLNDIAGRLSRIEAMLAARGPMAGRGHAAVGPGHHHGEPRRPGREVSPEMRKMMEARMQKRREQMQDARKKWENASPEEREEMKKQWQARMEEGRKKMQEAREKWENATPEEREEMKKKWQTRRREAYGSREKPRAERAEKAEQSVSPGDMRQAMQRMREEGRRRMEDAQAKMEAARKRFQEMEQRIKRLEAEVVRLRKAAEKDD